MNIWLYTISRLCHCVTMMWYEREHQENLMIGFLVLYMSQKVEMNLYQCLCILIFFTKMWRIAWCVLCEIGKWRYKCKYDKNELGKHIEQKKIREWKQVAIPNQFEDFFFPYTQYYCINNNRWSSAVVGGVFESACSDSPAVSLKQWKCSLSICCL